MKLTTNIRQFVGGQQSKLHQIQNETHNEIRRLWVGNKVNCIKSNQSKNGTHNDISRLWVRSKVNCIKSRQRREKQHNENILGINGCMMIPLGNNRLVQHKR
jgi:hypothetical protein